jgi:hypothetical protein
MLNCGYMGILLSWVGAHLMCMTWPEAWNGLYMHSVWACWSVAFNAPSSWSGWVWQMHRPCGHCKGKKKPQRFPFQNLVAKKGEADADADLMRFWQNRETLFIIRTMECTILGRNCAMESWGSQMITELVKTESGWDWLRERQLSSRLDMCNEIIYCCFVMTLPQDYLHMMITPP